MPASEHGVVRDHAFLSEVEDLHQLRPQKAVLLAFWEVHIARGEGRAIKHELLVVLSQEPFEFWMRDERRRLAVIV